MARSINNSTREFQELCYFMGMALAAWQNVEDKHFELFRKVAGIQDIKTASLIYHATESFDARRIMVDRVVRARLTSKEDNKEWDEIGKLLKDGNGNRNKIAHYTIEYDVVEQKELPDGGAEFVFG